MTNMFVSSGVQKDRKTRVVLVEYRRAAEIAGPVFSLGFPEQSMTLCLIKTKLGPRRENS